MDGVPSLLNPPPASSETSVATFDTVTVTAARSYDWGLFLDGAKALEPDTMLALEYRRDWQLPDYPQENGAFQSYNKTAHPFAVRVTMTKGGSVADRSAFLAKVEEVAASMSLYDVVTPEKTYLNMNVERFDYRRTSTNGAGLITVEMWLAEIRDATDAQFTSTKSPASASVVNGGNVQARTLTAAEAAAAGN